MNITYLIGNGFDIGLGLKTQYSDFVSKVTNKLENECAIYPAHEKASFDIAIKRWLLKNLKSKQIEFWHDAEEAFGTLGFSEIEGRSQDVVQHCHVWFQREMWEWVNGKNDLFRLPHLSEDLITKNFLGQLVCGWLGGLPQSVRNTIYRQMASEVVELNFISFNYTNIIEKLLSVFNQNRQYIVAPKTSRGSIQVMVQIGDCVHVHGEVSPEGNLQELVFGVDNGSQILDAAVSSSAENRRRLVKQDYIKYTHAGETERVLDILGGTSFLVTLGHSFGKTDSFWWDKIFNDLSSEIYKVVVCPYFKSDDEVPIDYGDAIRRPQMVVNNMFGALGEKRLNLAYEPQFMSGIYSVAPINVSDPDGGSNFCDYLCLSWMGKQCVKA